MADNVAITAGTGTSIATDDVGGAQWQRVKVGAGADGSASDVGGRAVDAGAALFVEARQKVVRLAVTPTVSTSPAYTAKDSVGGVMTFSNAARASGYPLELQAVQVADKSQQMPAMDLVLFDRNPGSGTFTDNAAADPTDTEIAQIVGVIPVGGYADMNDNSISDTACSRRMVLNGTDLFGVLIARATPTFVGTSDITVTLTIAQD